MALPISIPYTFANATTSIPLSQLDTDISTIYATVNGIGNGTVALSNVVITGGIISNVSGLSTSAISNGTSNVSIATANGNVTIATAGNNAVTVDTSQNMTTVGTVAMGSSFKRNRIINGNFNIWQRGTSFTVTGGVNDYSADRWRTEGSAINSVISQQTFTVGQTDVPGYPTYYCRVTTSSAPSSYWAFQQRIECPQNINGDGTYTLSFWAKAVSGTIAAGTFNYGINTASNNSPALTTAWQKITVTTTLSGVSQAGGSISIYLVYVSSSVSSLSVDIANVQVESGTLATPYERQIYSDQLAQCQRYYSKSYDITTVPGTVTNNGSAWNYVSQTAAVGDIGVSIPIKVTMRTAPTVVWYSPDTGNSGVCGSQAGDKTANSQYVGSSSIAVFITASNNNGQVRAHYTAAAEL